MVTSNTVVFVPLELYFSGSSIRVFTYTHYLESFYIRQQKANIIGAKIGFVFKKFKDDNK